MLQTIELSPPSQPKASIIWLHGLGADGYDFQPIAAELGLTQTRFIFPHAPYRAISAYNGYEMRAWYDIFGLDTHSPQDAQGIVAMQAEIENLIAIENQRGIPTERIVLAGFSQGGAMALHTALRYPHKLAGVLALSTYLPLRQRLHDEMHAFNSRTPILLAHGAQDDVIKLSTAQLALEALRDANLAVVWREYEMAHSVCHQEISDVKNFLTELGIN